MSVVWTPVDAFDFGPVISLDASIGRFRTLLGRFQAKCSSPMSVPCERSKRSAFTHATKLVRQVCDIAGEPDLIADAQAGLAASGLAAAVSNHDTGVLFDWWVEAISYQGVADTVALGYMEEHGSIAAFDIEQALQRSPSCPKLESYWHFENCGYRKSLGSCQRPQHFRGCPLPRSNLRNGSLNRAAYSLFLFMRDVAGGDFVAWLDERLAAADRPHAADRVRRLADALLEPLVHIHGVSYKVLSMSLATMLLGADPGRERWVVAGSGMIAVDTLVHNWLHRTGILHRFGAEHPYGARCYGEQGCASLLDAIAGRIDARSFNADFPKKFPRFVQKAIWLFCAQLGLNECNGNRIKDRDPCTRSDCSLYRRCDRVALRMADEKVAVE